MSEHPDDTTQPATDAPPRPPRDYYDDDATGYEPYPPDADEDDLDDAQQSHRDDTRRAPQAQHKIHAARCGIITP